MLVRIYIQQFLYNYISLWNLCSTKLLEYVGYVVISFLIELRTYGIDRNLIGILFVRNTHLLNSEVSWFRYTYT